MKTLLVLLVAVAIAASATRAAPTPNNSPIKHVVVLMMENHSFDNLLGNLNKLNPEVDG
jgi:phospholipase C